MPRAGSYCRASRGPPARLDQLVAVHGQLSACRTVAVQEQRVAARRRLVGDVDPDVVEREASSDSGLTFGAPVQAVPDRRRDLGQMSTSPAPGPAPSCPRSGTAPSHLLRRGLGAPEVVVARDLDGLAVLPVPNVKGPVPTGWALANFWISEADMPSQMCWGRIGIASPGSNACGWVKCRATVCASGVSTEASWVTHWAYWLSCLDLISSKVNLTSAEVNGLPSCQVAERSR